MPAFFLFQDYAGIFAELAKQGTAIVVLVVFFGFVIALVVKILPSWKEVKLAESVALTKQAEALGSLAAAQNNLATVVNNIAVEQKQSTDAVKILQRATNKSTEQLTIDVQHLNGTTEYLVSRLDALEKKMLDNQARTTLNINRCRGYILYFLYQERPSAIDFALLQELMDSVDFPMSFRQLAQEVEFLRAESLVRVFLLGSTGNLNPDEQMSLLERCCKNDMEARRVSVRIASQGVNFQEGNAQCVGVKRMFL